MIEIELPTDDATMRKLRVGDEVALNGVIVTARDRAHKYMVEESPTDLEPILAGTVIYHCGPVMRKESDGNWSVVAAGPTTSIREEIYQADVIERYNVRGVIGKGGMGTKTLAGLKKSGAVYLHAIGGASQILARSVKRVIGVEKLDEFGVPEAFWRFDVEKFPVVVTMDSTGASLHEQVNSDAAERYARIVARL